MSRVFGPGVSGINTAYRQIDELHRQIAKLNEDLRKERKLRNELQERVSNISTRLKKQIKHRRKMREQIEKLTLHAHHHGGMEIDE